MRVVSVLPSATETMYALGRGHDLVGRSAECDFPDEARSLPVVMRPRSWDAASPSADIDARVLRTRAAGESLYVLDLVELGRLRPDVLLTQDLCSVCSVTSEEVEAACRVAGVRPTIVALTPRNLPEVWDSIAKVGEAVGDAPAGRELAERLRHRTRASTSPTGQRVAVLEWLDPPILAGLWTPDIVEAAGGTPIGPGTGEVGRRTSWGEIAEQRPDLVILSPCSFSVDRTRQELAHPDLRTAVASLAGAPLGVFLADEAYFSRPGPRLIEGVDLVRHLLRSEPWTPPMPVESVASGGVVA